MKQEKLETSDALVKALDKCAADARAALSGTTDEFLMTPWQLLARGQVVQETPRWVMIQDTINHWAHHRGQMTVYLRLLGAKVPSIYGPSADDKAVPLTLRHDRDGREQVQAELQVAADSDLAARLIAADAFGEHPPGDLLRDR